MKEYFWNIANPLLVRIGALTQTDMEYVVRSGFWNNLSSISVTLLSLFLYLVFARFLTPETYGTYQYFLSLAVLVSSLTLTGIGTATAKSVAEGHDGAVRSAVLMQRAWMIVPIVCGLGASAFFFAIGNLSAALALLIISLLSPIQYTYNVYSGFLLGKKDFRRGFLYALSINVPFYALLSFLAVVSEQPLLLLAGNLLVQSVGAYLAYRAAMKAYAVPTAPAPLSTRLGKHLSVMGFLGTVANQVDALIAFHVLGPAQLAVYSFATAIPERLAGLLKFLPSAALPRFTERTEQEVRRGILARALPLFAFLIIASLGYALVAPYVYQLLFPAYISATPFSQLYALTMLGVVTQIILSALSAHEKIRSLYAYHTIVPILQIISVVAGAVWLGLWGLVLARVGMTLLSLVGVLFLLLRFKK